MSHNRSDDHVAGLILFAIPQHIPQLLQQLTLFQAEIPTFDEREGKIVIVLADDTEQGLWKKIEEVQALKNVLHLSLVYHQQATDET